MLSRHVNDCPVQAQLSRFPALLKPFALRGSYRRATTPARAERWPEPPATARDRGWHRRSTLSRRILLPTVLASTGAGATPVYLRRFVFHRQARLTEKAPPLKLKNEPRSPCAGTICHSRKERRSASQRCADRSDRLRRLG